MARLILETGGVVAAAAAFLDDLLTTDAQAGIDDLPDVDHRLVTR